MRRLEGSMVAIVTPMKDGAVDLRALRDLTEWQLAEGTDGIVPCGTTGEGVTLTPAERADVIRTVIETVRGRALVIAGAGSNATHEAIESVKLAKTLGADAALVVTPYYNKPTQEGLFRHYQAIWEATRFPVVAYNVPSRTSVDLLPETVARLAKAGAIAGIKEATANMDRQVQLVEKVGKDAIAYLSGDDFTVLPYIACGGHGVISVIANVAPRAMKELVVAARSGDLAGALAKQAAMAELNRMMFVETNPGPVKAAVALLGRSGGELRLPLAPVSEASLAKVRDAMVRFGLKLA
ncbi:dihydrodipicolinate synthase [Anaeromyxobacter dehalogenans 2CP-1]|uniref:4-hydroxy-tetrahydrodipicolinate synthase n=1 Tax=Anaeromyxobacter dehalogenans (strain ATCC BAA-258 / DSM 21875 / 2CP-1) TaxID=455488 RepID=DAPA_ANAD2|nr:4-hydroxy-tetrahydrodipicolinate synthase [Anaeromyxobacter dehalogenans]B8JAN5.1 RecName: Full=4-hydroxy-tetrahydrodipicolinate synthase; Short=HTPA synthase [Anaeromyxobacter dehalogenans 2CP-1]ACL67534.1 dihydrodipicolinate synthase [Anaeromyxobacter dehalogenans 2CP-1]